LGRYIDADVSEQGYPLKKCRHKIRGSGVGPSSSVNLISD
jgi:hypothetical protein